MELEKDVGMGLKVPLGLGGRWWEVGAREFELSLHWLPNLAATPPPYATPFPLPFMEDPPLPHAAVPRDFHHPQNFAGQAVPRGTRWSAKFRGPICASRHTHEISRANPALILKISKKHAVPPGTDRLRIVYVSFTDHFRIIYG